MCHGALTSFFHVAGEVERRRGSVRAKWVIVILAVCLVVTVAAIAYAAGKTSAPEVIQAQRFELVDAEGSVLASLGETGGTPTLSLFEKGRSSAGLMLLGSGVPGLRLFDQKGRLCARMALDDDKPDLCPPAMLSGPSGRLRSPASRWYPVPHDDRCEPPVECQVRVESHLGTDLLRAPLPRVVAAAVSAARGTCGGGGEPAGC